MRKLLTILSTLLAFSQSSVLAQETFPVNGIPDKRKTCYAFTHVRLFVDYKTILDSATLIIQDGLITGAGKQILIPQGAVITDLGGYSIYPAFIDLFSDYGMPEIKKAVREARGPQFISGTKGPFGWNQAIRPEQQAAALFSADDKKADELRQAGFALVMSHMQDGIARGTAVFASLGKDKEQKLILREKAAACYSFDKGTSTQDYPGSLMGAIALLRQTYLDARWYKNTGSAKEVNLSLQAWNENQSVPQVFEVKDKYSALRAARLGSEFGVFYIIRGNGDEYQRLEELKASCRDLIIPVNFPEAVDVSDPYDAQNISLAGLKHWEMAPGNAAALEKAGIRFAFTASGLKSKKDFLLRVRQAAENGLSEQAALAACTYNPAVMIGAESVAGSLKKGMLANFLITSGNIFDKKTVIYENWIQGNRHVLKPMPEADRRGNYELLIGNLKPLNLRLSGTPDALIAQVESDTLKITATFSEMEGNLLITFDSSRTGKGLVRLNGNSMKGDRDMAGSGFLPDGTPVAWQARYLSALAPEVKKDSLKRDSVAVKPVTGPLLFPNMAFGFKSLPAAGTVFIRNVTVWTNEKEGVMKNTDVVLKNGKIFRVGAGLDPKNFPEAETVDGTGRHLTAGIIDEHSHIAISGDVNECTQAVTSEVRIGDVVDADDINIYRQLAGGVTSAHLLHGSCNPVGGQSQLIKLRWGMEPEKMKVTGWDPFIKFALGENVKQSNWGDLNVIRYPQTRMGVEQTYIDAFSRAREYRNAWRRYETLPANDKKFAPAPRKDLELDALAEILDRKRFITCHSYQQGEINMLMHVADSFGFRVNTFTHILEGFKVADKMKKHGVGASSFSDWWAYKYEVIEAIPYNGAILHDMGIVTAFNSDDAEMARRLNQEAAKAVMYGGVTEEEALKFVTLNPARLLHVDDIMGSIREGKDADVVLWSDNPLSVYARVEKTYVDGICYFDLGRDEKLQQEVAAERARIIQKMIAAKNKGASVQKPVMSIKELHHCIDRENARSEKSIY